MKRNEEIT